MATLTAEETKAFVEKLIASGKGDQGRLQHILNVIREGRKLYNSDQKYLDSILAQEIGLQQKPKVEESIVTQVQRLLADGRGDSGRLGFILESLKQGKSLYHSDQKYLEAKLGHKVGNQIVVKPQQDANKTIESIKSQVLVANQKIANLESVLSKKVTQLQKIQDVSTAQQVVVSTRGAMPKGWQGQSAQDELEKIQQQISVEQVKFDKGKSEAERLKIEQSKLMQTILNRQEFEKQVKIEQQRLEKQIEQERQSIQHQARLVEQIKAQESELERAKRERDLISQQLAEEQSRLSASISAQKAILSEVKNEYEKVASEIKRQEQEIAKQVEQERLRLAQQAEVAKKIQAEKEQLETIRDEHQKIIEQTKSQEQELAEQLKKEKERLAQQQKMLKTITSYEKHLVASRQK